jgi:PAS domain S-box-containing protein
MADPSATYQQLIEEIASLEREIKRLKGLEADRLKIGETLDDRSAFLAQPVDNAAGIEFEDLFDLDEIQRLQDELCRAAGVAGLLTGPDGRPITRPSNFSRFCKDIVRSTERGQTKCRTSDAQLGQYHPGGPVVRPCLSAGLWGAGASITVGGRHIANWLVGQVRNEAQSEENIRAYARELGIDEQAFVEAFYEVPVMSTQQFHLVAQAFFTVASLLSRAAFQNLQQTRYILERKRAGEALSKSESLIRAITDSVQDAIVMMDPEGRISFWNKAAEHIFGHAKEEAVGAKLHRLVTPERFLRTYGRAFEMFRTGGRTHSPEKSVELRACRKDGEEFPIELSLSAIRLEDGWHAVGIMRDITERKKAEEELYESRRRLEDIIEFLPDATLVIDREGKVIAWNRAIETLTGVSKDQMLGKGDYEYAIPFYGEKRPILIDYALHPEMELEHDYTAFQRVGNVLFGEAYTPGIPPGDFHVYATASVLHDLKGNVIAAIECIRDDTERKKLADRLNRAEKMEGLGRLAGGVAHDMNNVLGVLVGCADLLRASLPKDTPYWKYADDILNSGLRGAAIIQDLLTLARRGVAVSEVVNLNSIVDDYLKTPEFDKLKSDHPAVRINVELADGLLNTRGSPVHLSKTLANLVSNAVEALPGSGEIVIRTENRYLDVPIQGYDSMKEGDYTILSVSDTGKGISDLDMGKIFEPFYTNKVMGRSGTGLGLAVVWGTVKDHDGYIDVKSEEGVGSTFTIYLPVTREEIVKRKKIVDSIAYRGKGETILVVDDVKEQRELAVNMLTVLGYAAEAAASGEEAIESLLGKTVDLLLLDMVMEPGMDGLETYGKVLETHPGQKAVIVSGFSETDRVKKAQALGAGAFVRKPYILEKIGLAVRRELDRSKDDGASPET